MRNKLIMFELFLFICMLFIFIVGGVGLCGDDVFEKCREFFWLIVMVNLFM